MKVAVALDLSFDAVEEVAFELLHLAAAQARHVHVVALRTPLVEVAFALHVQQVELVDEAVPFQQPQRAIDRHAINVGIDAYRLAQDLRCVQVLAGRLNDAQNYAALLRHADAARQQRRLQRARSFGLRKRHSVSQVRRSLKRPGFCASTALVHSALATKLQVREHASITHPEPLPGNAALQRRVTPVPIF